MKSHHPIRRLSALPALTLALLAHISQSVQAASANWTGGGSDALWSNLSNWSASPVPGASDNATFNAAAGAGGAVIDVGSGLAINELIFSGSAAAYTIGTGAANSQTLTLAAASPCLTTTSANAPTINATLELKGTCRMTTGTGAPATAVTFNGDVRPSAAVATPMTLNLNTGSRSLNFNGVIADSATAGGVLSVAGGNISTAKFTGLNTYTGTTTLGNSFVLTVNTIKASGSPSALGKSGIIHIGDTFGIGTLKYNGSGDVTDRTVNLAGSTFGATIDQSGTGLLKFTSDVTATSAGSKLFTLQGSTAGTGEIAGKIGDALPKTSTTTVASAVGVTTLTVSDTKSFRVGCSVSGTGIASGTYVTAASSGTATLSAAVVAPGVASGATITFGGNVLLTKAGTGTWTLSGANTYSGRTTVSGGVLACSSAVSLGGGALTINGGKLQLNYTGTRQVASLTLGTTAQAYGSYGSSFSSATNKNDTYFTGTGTVTYSPPTTPTTTTLALTGGSTPSTVGAPLTFTATVAGGTPTGNVTFYAGATALSTSALNGSYQASLTTSSLALGSYSITAQYAGDAAFGASTSSALAIQVNAPAGTNNILTCTFPSLPATTIVGSNISVTVPYATDVTALAPTYTMTAGATGNPLSGTARDFTTAQTYTITGADNAIQVYTVTVNKTAASTAKDILTFTIPSFGTATLAGTNISLTVPFATNVTALAPTYTISPLATAAPASGISRNFTSPQTYTVTAEDGSTQVYTVTVTVSSALPTTFSWASAVAGNWSDGSKWTNNLANGAAPLAAGQTDYTLNFNVAGSYTATSDLSAGCQLNQLNLGGAVTLAGNSLAFTANGATLPTLNQNSASAATISTAASLASNLTFGGSGSGTVTLSGLLAGSGSLTKNGSGILTINNASNTFSGGTIINAGQLTMNVQANAALGTGPVTLNSGATLFLERINATNPLTLNGGTIVASNGFGDSWNAAVNLTANTTINAPYNMSFGGSISGAGGFIKTGASQLSLAGSNSHTGAMAVQAGTLSVASLNSVSGGTATSNLGAPATVTAGTISLGSTTTAATLLYTGAGETTDRVIQLAGTTGGATLTQAGTGSGIPTTRGTSGLLKFTGNVSIPGSPGVDNRKTLTLTQLTSMTTGTSTGRGELSGSLGDSLSGTAGQLATSLTKAGGGTWTLSGANSYSGATKVQAGTLVFTRADALGGGTLDITTGAVVQLDYVGTRQISALSFNAGTALPNGTYGSSASLATNKNDTYFSGLGMVTVGSTGSATTTSLERSAGTNPSNGGVAVTITATVAGTAPTGNVQFYDGLTLIGTSALNGSYQAGLTTSTLGGGTHSLTALYVGDAGNALSCSTPLAHTVNDTRASTTTTLASGNNPSNYGAAVTFTATVTGSTPTGTVTFYNGSTALGSATLNGSAQALLTTSGLPAGWRAITARYAGDANNSPATSTPPLFQTVNPSSGNGKVKVFILAGQSNMQGKGRVETGRDPNNLTVTSLVGGLGSLRNMLNKNPDKYGYLADPAHPTTGGNPGWITRDDVWVTYWSDPGTGENRRGNLDADFGDTGGQGRIGPEYAFGLQLGSQLGDQVLLIKYAFGGKSLKVDFRPPSSGGTVGPYYTGMVARVNQVLANLASYFPSYSGQGYEIAGFAWHQGWNDIGETTAEYETNLTNLIVDLRNNLGVPKLPVCIGNTGMANGSGGNVLVAQMNVGNSVLHPEFAGTVTTVDTRPFDYGELLGGSSEGYHWFWNAESYFNIGESMGRAMLALLPATVSKSPFEIWAADPAQGLTTGVNDGPADDPDHDGLTNLLEFALGGAPLVSSRTILPGLTNQAGAWVFEYERSNAAQSSTTQMVEYGSDLTGWTQLTIPAATSGDVTVIPGTPTDHVKVVLPVLGTKGFVRLKVTQ